MIAVARVAPLLRDFGAAAPLAAPVLTVADHADNTGATATLAGAALGSVNGIYVQSFQGDLGSGIWLSSGSLNNNGAIALDLAVGHYFAYAASSNAGSTAISNITYFVVSDGLEALHARCLAAVQARIRSLALAGLSGDHVVVKKLPLDRPLVGSGGIGLPAIVVSPRREAMPSTEGTNGLDDVQHDVLVVMFDRDNQEETLQLNLDRHLLWRQQVARAFRNQRLTGIPEVINAAVEPAEGLLSEAWKQELLVSALLLRFTSRETRGFN